MRRLDLPQPPRDLSHFGERTPDRTEHHRTVVIVRMMAALVTVDVVNLAHSLPMGRLGRYQRFVNKARAACITIVVPTSGRPTPAPRLPPPPAWPPPPS